MAVRPGIRRLLRIRRLDAAAARSDVDDEMQLHLTLRAEQLMRDGLDAAAAEAEARRLFALDESTVHALYTTARERNEYMRIRERVESWIKDVRYAARGLARDRTFTCFVAGALAIGMGANVTAFTLFDRVLLRDPAHVVDASAVARLYGRVNIPTIGERTSSWIPHANYLHLRETVRALDPVGAYRVRQTMVGRGASGRPMRVAQATGAYFQVFGVRAVHGRFFLPEEDFVSAGALAVISEDLWRTAFGADSGIVGSSIVVADTVHTIIGVAPAGFSGGELRRIDVWQLGNSGTAGFVNWQIVGRLRPNATLASAGADAFARHQTADNVGPGWFRAATIFAAPLRVDDTGREPVEVTMARWLALVCALILAVTLANVVNLLLARLARRRRELAVRVALGSGRGRVIRLLTLEGVLLAMLAGAASLLVARVVEPIVRQALFASDATWTRSVADARVIVMLLMVVMATAIIIGVIPALRAGKPDLSDALRSGTAGGGGTNSRTRAWLTVAQAALSVALLVGAGLFLRSLSRVNAVDLGVDHERVMVAHARLAVDGDFAARSAIERAVYRSMAAAVLRVPQVEHASVAIGLPLDGGAFSAKVFLTGRDSIPILPGGGPFVSAVDGAYFATTGTRVLAGRAFTEADREGSEPVLIVGQTMARLLWPGDDAIGKCLSYGFATAPCARVVGVVADIHRRGLREEASMQYYIPLGQQSMFGGASLLVRPRDDRKLSWVELRELLVAVDPRIRSIELKPLSDALAPELRPLKLGMVTFGLSSALALLVAVLGLYGLMSYMVAWRTREIGIRLALGASDLQLTRLIVSGGARLAALGVVIGLSIALTAARWIQPHLFDTSASDPVVFGGVALLVLVTALLAGALPARRALRISPTEALRAE